MKPPINSTWHAFEMLAARHRIETEIENGGIEIDSECRETIVDALYVYVDAALLDLEEAEAENHHSVSWPGDKRPDDSRQRASAAVTCGLRGSLRAAKLFNRAVDYYLRSIYIQPYG